VPDESGLIGSWTRLARRRWLTGALTGIPVFAVAVAIVFLTKPIYRSESLLRLAEPPPAGGVSPMSGALSLLRPGGDPFANDMEVMASRSLAESVVERNTLNARLIAPAGWYRDSLVSELRASRATKKAAYSIAWQSGRVRVTSLSNDSLVADVAPGEPAVFGGVTAVFRPWRPGMPEQVRLKTDPFARAVQRARSAVRTERPRREANVLSVAYNDVDPAIADNVVSTAVTEFIRFRTQLQQRESGQTVDSLRAVSRTTADELRRAEELLAAFQESSRLVAPDVQGEALVERQSEVITRLERARAELMGVDEMLRRLEEASAGDKPWTALLSYPTFFDNQTLGELLTSLLELYSQRAQLQARLAPSNREVVAVTRQIEYFETSLRTLAHEYRAGLEESISVLEPQAAAFDSILTSMPAAVVELGRRQRDVRLLAEVLVLTEQRLRQEELRDALTYSNVQVIDPPALRDRPVWPRKKIGPAVGLVIAFVFAMIGMVVRDRTDVRVRRVTQLHEAIDRPVLAVVEIGRGSTFALSSIETAALLRRAGISANGGRALTLVPLRETLVPKVAALPPGATGTEPGQGDDNAVETVAPIRGFADAATVVATDAPAALLIEAGRTTTGELRRVIRLIEEAGGTVAGVVLVCRGDREARSAWS